MTSADHSHAATDQPIVVAARYPDVRLATQHREEVREEESDRIKLIAPIIDTIRATQSQWLPALACGSMGLIVLLVSCRVMLSFALWKQHRVEPHVAKAYEQIPKRRAARLLKSSKTVGPISFGIVRPTIVIPASLCEPENSNALRHALRHEQVHVDRYDAVGHALINLALPILYFNPFYWYLRSQVAFCRELIADDVAAGHSHKKDYVHELIKMLRNSKTPNFTTLGALGMFRLQTPFTRRMTMLLSRKEQLQRKANSVFRVSISVLALSCVIGISWFTPNSIAADKVPSLPNDEPSKILDQTDQKDAPSAAEEKAVEPEDVSGFSDPFGAKADSSESPRFLAKIVGFVEAKNRIDVASQIEGVVKTTQVNPGRVVKKGEILIRLDDRKAVANLSAAKAEFDSLRRSAGDASGVELAKDALEVARYKLRALEKGAASQLSVSEQKLEALRAEIALKKAMQEREKNQLQVELAGEKLKLAEFGLSQHVIRSPINGIVTQVHVQPTEWTNAGAPISRIVSLDKIVVRGSVSSNEFNASEIQGRMAIVSLIIARGEIVKLRGKTIFASPEIDESGRFEVHVECQNQKRDGRWLASPGMAAEIGFLLDGTAEPKETQKNVSAKKAVPGLTNAEEIGFLKDLVKSASRTYDVIHAKYEQGIEGGSAADLAMAALHLKTALAKLSVANGKYKDAAAHYKNAIHAAETHLEALQVQMEAGSVKYEVLIQAQNNLAQTKLDYLRVLKAASAKK